MNDLWIAVTQPGEAHALVDKLGGGTHPTAALAIGTREVAEDAARCAPHVAWIDTGDYPAEAFARGACSVLQQSRARVVLGYATPGARAAMGLFAQATDAACVSNVIGVSVESDALVVDHLIVDNRVIESVSLPTPACLVVDTMAFQPEEGDAVTALATIERIEAKADTFCEVIAVEAIPDCGLESAKRVVGVGRGVNTPEKFALAQQLAHALDAELGGSMPGVQDFNHFPADAHYIGLTGVNLNSELYIAIGISGSTPHLAGIQNAGTVVCINNDSNAQFFDHADYGIVADMQEAVPELIRALE